MDKNMTYEIVSEFPHEIIFEKGEPCISLYQPIYRAAPDNMQNPIIFRNLMRQIEDSLAKRYDKREISTNMDVFYQIEKDNDFWIDTRDGLGLAVLSNRERCVVYKLKTPVPELAIVADSMHIKPLIKAFQSTDKYQILGLSRGEFKLYEGNRYELHEVQMPPDTKVTLEEVLGSEVTEEFITHGSYGGYSGSSSGGIIHGHGGKKDEVDKDIDRYFRYVDKFIAENYSKPSKLPLMLLTLTEYHTHFRKISNNSHLMEEGLRYSHDSLDLDEMREKAWEILQPIHWEKRHELLDAFEYAYAHSLGLGDVAEIARAAIEGRVKSLLIESDRIVPGKIDETTGKVEFGNLEAPGRDDVLDDLAELALRMGGEVVLIPQDKMPVKSGVAAILRSSLTQDVSMDQDQSSRES